MKPLPWFAFLWFATRCLLASEPRDIVFRAGAVDGTKALRPAGISAEDQHALVTTMRPLQTKLDMGSRTGMVQPL